MVVQTEDLIQSLEEPILRSLLVARQVLDNATSTTSSVATAKPTCGGEGLDPNASFNMRLHIDALFVILITSTTGTQSSASDPFLVIILLARGCMALTWVGAFFPIAAKRIRALKIPNTAFIIAKFFGSGVIIATAFIHVSLNLLKIC